MAHQLGELEGGIPPTAVLPVDRGPARRSAKEVPRIGIAPTEGHRRTRPEWKGMLVNRRDQKAQLRGLIRRRNVSNLPGNPGATGGRAVHRQDGSAKGDVGAFGSNAVNYAVVLDESVPIRVRRRSYLNLYPFDPGLDDDGLTIARLLQQNRSWCDVEAGVLEREEGKVFRSRAIPIVADGEFDRKVAALTPRPVEKIVAPAAHRLDLPLSPDRRPGWHVRGQVIEEREKQRRGQRIVSLDHLWHASTFERIPPAFQAGGSSLMGRK